MDLRKFFNCLSPDEQHEMKNIVRDHFSVNGQSNVLTVEEVAMSKLQAIQSVRNRLGLGLIMAKDLVEREQLLRR